MTYMVRCGCFIFIYAQFVCVDHFLFPRVKAAHTVDDWLVGIAHGGHVACL